MTNAPVVRPEILDVPAADFLYLPDGRRTASGSVTFTRPFILTGMSDVEPAGTYTTLMEEEQLAGLSFAAWKRISTVIQLEHAGCTEHLAVDPAELRNALLRDGAQEHASHPASQQAAIKRRRMARKSLFTGKGANR